MLKKTILFIVFTILIQGVSFSQCAMCKATAESSGAGGGLNDGIVYIMFVPYLLLGTFVILVFRKKLYSFWKELMGRGEKKEYNIDNWY